MKSWKLALCAATASLAFAGAAAAEDLTVAYNIGVASDYVFRGQTQTNEDPQIFGGVDVSYGKTYAGIWLSNVDFSAPGVPNDTSAEFDIYAGYKTSIGPVATDFGVIYYGYADAAKGSDQAYTEIKVAGSVPVGKATLGGAVFYSPDFFGAADEAWYYEINGSIPIVDKLSASAAIGHQDQDKSVDYNTWNIGATYSFTSNVSLDVRYADTDEHSLLAGLGDSKVFATLKAAF